MVGWLSAIVSSTSASLISNPLPGTNAMPDGSELGGVQVDVAKSPTGVASTTAAVAGTVVLNATAAVLNASASRGHRRCTGTLGNGSNPRDGLHCSPVTRITGGPSPPAWYSLQRPARDGLLSVPGRPPYLFTVTTTSSDTDPAPLVAVSRSVKVPVLVKRTEVSMLVEDVKITALFPPGPPALVHLKVTGSGEPGSMSVPSSDAKAPTVS